MGMGQKLGLSLVAIFVGLFIYAVVFEEDPVSMDPAHILGTTHGSYWLPRDGWFRERYGARSIQRKRL